MQPVVTEILSQNFFKHSSLNSQLFNTLLHDDDDDNDVDDGDECSTRCCMIWNNLHSICKLARLTRRWAMNHDLHNLDLYNNNNNNNSDNITQYW